ncbi:uncharacterized protein LOC132711664 [Pantherophis guttatus]|uniref:Uncharacterized protein LOC132711664 n=1 Tax=Pantherophis guttatus TaxID=94885 RepID=A0ABM3ZFH9_PANGU|nr:uncharacterized protein LOC132711664 [Pantherophis guttatus]
MERASKKAQADKNKALGPPQAPPLSVMAPPTEIQAARSQPSHTPSLSPDRSLQGDTNLADASTVFLVSTAESSIIQAETQDVALTALVQSGSEIASLISMAIRQGIAEGLHQRAPSEASEMQSHQSHSHRHQESRDTVIHQESHDSPQSKSQDSLSEGEIISDQDLSEDEGLEPDQPAFVDLFNSQMFRSLLFKAQITTRMRLPSSSSGSSSLSSDPTTSVFLEPTVRTEVVPAPKLFSDVVQRQWNFPSTGPLPNSLDKRFYNLATDFSNILQVPSVDSPVVALSSSSPVSGPAEEVLRLEDKRAERNLIKGHQASSWSVQASFVTSFFNRATILWLKQLQERIPATDHRSHQDLNQILVVVEFSADATLNAACFSAKAIGSSVTSRCLLWLKNWQADQRAKWRLASSLFQGDKLFGAPLEPLLVETKDHRKILPSISRRSEIRPQTSFHSGSFWAHDSSFYQQCPHRPFHPRGSHQQESQQGVAVVSPTLPARFLLPFQRNLNSPSNLLLHLTSNAIDSLKWWTSENVSKGSSFLEPQRLVITMDASLVGWGSHLGRHMIQGRWAPQECDLNINLLELRAIFLALQGFRTQVQGRDVLILTDNIIAKAHLNRQGGIRS